MEKLKNGKYRVRKMVNGINYCMTFDHRPTQKEILDEITLRSGNNLQGNKLTFSKASASYNELKEGTLSDATIREYSRMCNRLPKWFVDMEIRGIDDVIVQKLIKEMSKTVSAKTVKDRYAYVTSVLRLYDPKTSFNVSLPRIVEKEPYLPTYEEIEKLIDGSVGTQYHIALQLARYGLRREEICCLNVDDVFEMDGNYFVTISKALIQNKNKEWVESLTKTEDSNRIVPIDKDLALQILELGEGKAYRGYPEAISTYLKRQQDKLGMEHFGLHRFRHAFCTKLAENNVDEATILALGGWKKNSDVMKRVYRHSNIHREKERMNQVLQIIKS